MNGEHGNKVYIALSLENRRWPINLYFMSWTLFWWVLVFRATLKPEENRACFFTYFWLFLVVNHNPPGNSEKKWGRHTEYSHNRPAHAIIHLLFCVRKAVESSSNCLKFIVLVLISLFAVLQMLCLLETSANTILLKSNCSSLTILCVCHSFITRCSRHYCEEWWRNMVPNKLS